MSSHPLTRFLTTYLPTVGWDRDSALNTLPGARHKLSKGMKMLQYLRDFCADVERVETLLGQLLNPRVSPRSFDDRDDNESEPDGEGFC
jgi:hypothetical protein